MKKQHLLKSAIYFLLIPLFSTQILFAQENDPEYNESCTCIMVGKDASTDGSVMTSHTCDAYYRTWLEFVPAQNFDKDAVHDVNTGTMHTSAKWSKEHIKLKGQIPEAKQTYAKSS